MNAKNLSLLVVILATACGAGSDSVEGEVDGVAVATTQEVTEGAAKKGQADADAGVRVFPSGLSGDPKAAEVSRLISVIGPDYILCENYDVKDLSLKFDSGAGALSEMSATIAKGADPQCRGFASADIMDDVRGITPESRNLPTEFGLKTDRVVFSDRLETYQYEATFTADGNSTSAKLACSTKFDEVREKYSINCSPFPKVPLEELGREVKHPSDGMYFTLIVSDISLPPGTVEEIKTEIERRNNLD